MVPFSLSSARQRVRYVCIAHTHTQCQMREIFATRSVGLVCGLRTDDIGILHTHPYVIISTAECGACVGGGGSYTKIPDATTVDAIVCEHARVCSRVCVCVLEWNYWCVRAYAHCWPELLWQIAPTKFNRKAIFCLSADGKLSDANCRFSAPCKSHHNAHVCVGICVCVCFCTVGTVETR